MSPFHISDPEADRLVRLLATRRGLHLTEAIKLAVRNELLKDETDDSSEKPENAGSAIVPQSSLEDQLERFMRSTTLEYTRLLATARKKKGVGSRVYQMLGRHGPVETLNRLINHHTDGLLFLKSIDRLDLSAECIALLPEYKNLISEGTRARAGENLQKVAVR